MNLLQTIFKINVSNSPDYKDEELIIPVLSPQFEMSDDLKLRMKEELFRISYHIKKDKKGVLL